jgi:tetratricopeptide (TPR) repeat protein
MWSPAAFTDLARDLVGGANDTSADAVDSELLEALTAPRAATLQEQNVRLSAALRAHPRSAALHDRAALLLASLALRESGGLLSDPRPMMSRMTAHLAVAGALQQVSASAERQLARAALVVLVNRQQDAIARLDAIDSGTAVPSVRALSRALRVRATRDWRLVPDPAAATFVEQREAVRAAKLAIGDSAALRLLGTVRASESDIDWARVIFHENPKVEAGGMFASLVIPGELAEAAAIRATFPAPPPPGQLAAALNDEPWHGPAHGTEPEAFWIIDWGPWAAASQRHLAAGIVCVSRHYWDMLGMPDEAKAFENDARRSFGTMRMFAVIEPHLVHHRKDAASFNAALARANTLVRQHPELVPDGVLTDLHEQPRLGGAVPELPPNVAWFRPFVPVGTAFEPHRVYGVKWSVRPGDAELAALRAIAPFEMTFMHAALTRTYGHGQIPPDVLDRTYGAIAPYTLAAAWMHARAAYRTNDEQYLKTVTAIAERLAPDDYYYVASLLADKGRADVARLAYEHYAQVATDQVTLSNTLWPLALYYLEHGQVREALRVGRRTADVYSATGLVTYASVLEMSGNLRLAAEVWNQAAERYENFQAHKAAFFVRHPEQDARHERDRLVAALFPGGPQRIDDKTPTAPSQGLRIVNAGFAGAREGLREGDIIAGIDGIAVANLPQYNLQKFRTWSPEMRFLVGRDNRYVSVDTHLRHRWIANDLEPLSE